jgi:hypothetical protein
MMLVASALIRTAQLHRGGAKVGGVICGGMLGACLYLQLSIDSSYVIPRIDQRNKLEAS